jgi:DNA-binding GntR family transcriptional regulator
MASVMAAAVEEEASSAPNKVFRAILEGLYRGRFVAGQRLVEADLMREFKVGRGSVREALNRLAADGVVTLSFNRGAQIRSLTRSEAKDIVAVSEALVTLAAKLAAGKIGEGGNRKLLRQSLDRLLDFIGGGDPFEFVRARNAFYRALVQIGANRELARVLPGIQVHLVRTQFRGYEGDPKRLRLQDYRMIAEAVLQGSTAKAEKAARLHFKSVCETIENLPADAFAREP